MRHGRDDGTADEDFAYRSPAKNGGHSWVRGGPLDGDLRDKAARPAGGADWGRVAAGYAGKMDRSARQSLEHQLGLPPDALDALPLVGRCDDSSTTWPEYDAAGNIIGIVRRVAPTGEKRSLKGSRRGLTLPAAWAARPGPVYVVEGATDAVAMTAAGLACVGRPSNAGSLDLLAELFRSVSPGRAAVVVGENDVKMNGDHPGAACEDLARRLAAALGRPVAFAYPPPEAKDVRAWLTAAARGADGWPERGAQLAHHVTATKVDCRPPAAPPGQGPAAPARPKVPGYQPFPVAALAPVLREYVTQLAASIPADPAYAALPALAVVGAAIGAAMVVSPKRGYREAPALWACTVGDSGTGKSPAARPTERLAFDIDKRMRDRHRAETANYLAALEKWEGQDSPDPADKPAKPTREHFVVVDITVERLAEVLAQSPRGVVMARDELDGWFGSFTRYKGKGGSDIPNWLSLYDAGPLRVHRRTGEPRDIEVDRSFVAVTGGIQPDILRAVLADPAYVASGLAARVMFAMPPKAIPRWSDAELSPDAEDRLAAALDYLRELAFDPTTGPSVVTLTPQAKRRFVAMNNEFAAAAEGVDGGPMSAVLPKAVRFALRLALIDHCLRHADLRSDPTKAAVSDASMESGEALARWLVREAERVYAVCDEKPADRDDRTLIDWVRRRHPDGVTARTVQRNLRRYKAAGVAEAALDGMVKAGLGAWSDRRTGPEGGAPTRVFKPAGEPDPAAADIADAADDTTAVAATLPDIDSRGEDVSVPSASAQGGCGKPTGVVAVPSPRKRRYTPDDRPYEARGGKAGGGS